MDYSLTVSIDTGILPTLINAGYKLCIAKKVNGVYTVIWQGSNVLPNDQFSWSAKYQVYGSIAFNSGALVRATTNVQNIMSGETCVLDNFGIMNPASGSSDDSGIFTVQNNYGLINIATNSYVNGTYAPSYVSTNPVVSGPNTLQPIETVMVWFETNVTTGTMILDASSQAIEVDFTSIPTHTLLYKVPDGGSPGAGVWYLDNDQAVLPMTYNRLSNSFSIPEPNDATLALLTDFLNAPSHVGAPHAFTVPIVATAEFATIQVAASFKDYLTAHRPDGFASWEVSKTANSVSVAMQVAVAADEEAAVRAASDKYLEIVYDFGGPKFKELRLTVEGRPVDPIAPVGPTKPTQPGDPTLGGTMGNGNCGTTTGTAIVRFQDQGAAATFAEQINESTSPGTTFNATARGVAVTLKLEAKGQHDVARKRIRQAYEAAMAAFQGIPGQPQPIYVGPIVWVNHPSQRACEGSLAQ
ncbi:hypothetical protein C2E23DRAFT_886533 [Lenzites betulinus]|nr:hypothetical protein C2E23DRAFT_886533 [Lenzites betulinus]